MKQTHGLSIFLVIAIFALAVPVNGQNSTGNDGCNFCFRGKPKGKCCSFLIFETGLLTRIGESGQPRGKSSFLITADLGLIFNKTKNSAIGGSFHIAADDNGHRYGIGLRYRKWLWKTVAIDLSPRLLIAGSDNTVKNSYPGFAFTASLSIYELLSIDAYFDIIRYEQEIFSYPFNSTSEMVKKTQTGIYLGASTRSWVTLVPILAIILATSTSD